jgi:hypothetical protein
LELLSESVGSNNCTFIHLGFVVELSHGWLDFFIELTWIVDFLSRSNVYRLLLLLFVILNWLFIYRLLVIWL